MFLAHLVAVLDCLDTIHVQKRLEGPEMQRNLPEEQSMRQKDQQVAGNDTKNDPKGA